MDSDDLYRAWIDAEQARRDHAADYISIGSPSAGPMVLPNRVITHDALAEFDAHDRNVKAAREAFYTAARPS